MKKYQRSVEHDGVCVAKMNLIMPDFGDDSRMGRFYLTLTEECMKWFEEKCIPSAIEKYENSDDDRKRWRWTPTVFCINCVIADKDNQRRCILDVSLTDGSSSLKTQRTQSWDTIHDRLCKMNVKKLSIANSD